MADTQKLDEAFQRFETALRQIEDAIVLKVDGQKRVETLESETEGLRRDRVRLAHELERPIATPKQARQMLGLSETPTRY